MGTGALANSTHELRGLIDIYFDLGRVRLEVRRQKAIQKTHPPDREQKPKQQNKDQNQISLAMFFRKGVGKLNF